jgi:hypothetical protein
MSLFCLLLSCSHRSPPLRLFRCSSAPCNTCLQRMLQWEFIHIYVIQDVYYARRVSHTVITSNLALPFNLTFLLRHILSDYCLPYIDHIVLCLIPRSIARVLWKIPLQSKIAEFFDCCVATPTMRFQCSFEGVGHCSHDIFSHVQVVVFTVTVPKADKKKTASCVVYSRSRGRALCAPLRWVIGPACQCECHEVETCSQNVA